MASRFYLTLVELAEGCRLEHLWFCLGLSSYLRRGLRGEAELGGYSVSTALGVSRSDLRFVEQGVAQDLIHGK